MGITGESGVSGRELAVADARMMSVGLLAMGAGAGGVGKHHGGKHSLPSALACTGRPGVHRQCRLLSKTPTG